MKGYESNISLFSSFMISFENDDIPLSTVTINPNLTLLTKEEKKYSGLPSLLECKVSLSANEI